MPRELILQIIDHAGPCGCLALRCTSRFFRNVIRPSSQEGLLAAETEDFAIAGELYTCNGCLRLRREWKFNRRMIWNCADPWEYVIFDEGIKRGGERAYERFCNECGARDLPADFRYPFGGSWTDEEEKQEPGHYCSRCEGTIRKMAEYVRCQYCKKVKKVPQSGHGVMRDVLRDKLRDPTRSRQPLRRKWSIYVGVAARLASECTFYCRLL